MSGNEFYIGIKNGTPIRKPMKQDYSQYVRKVWCSDCCSQHEEGKHFTKEELDAVYRGVVK